MSRAAKGAGMLVRMALAVCLAGAPLPASAASAQSEEVIQLWTATPTDTHWSGPEQTGESAAPTGSKIAIKSNVTVPTITVVRPPAGKANGSAMLVAPGGAFMALAWDLEGTEVAHWLADRGITAFVLKYRVGPPKREAGQPMPTDIPGLIRLLEPNRQLAVADASQAMKLIRTRAKDLGIRPDRIGMMGFSAGAMTTMGVVMQGGAEARPSVVAPIYGLIPADAKVPSDAPPAFIAVAADDATVPGSGSIDIFRKWNEAKRPAELHIYEKGNHGFGMRPQGLPVDSWPNAFEGWLKQHQMIPGEAAAATAAAKAD